MRRFFCSSLALILVLSFSCIDTIYAATERSPISGTPLLRPQRLQLLRDYGPAARIKAERVPERTILADTVGQQANPPFYAYNFATNSYYPVNGATCRSVTALSSGYSLFIYVEDAEYSRDPSRFTTAILSSIASEYINNIVPKETTYFGNPPTGNFTILLLDIQDSGVNTFVSGYFDPRNETNLPNSNGRHMIYMDSRQGTPGSTSFFGTFAHEFNHFIQYSYDPNEETWVEEGMAGLARVVCGYGPQVSHVNYFGLTPTTSLIVWNDTLENYGASLLFMLYVEEHYGGANITNAIVRNTGTGINGVNSALLGNGYSVTVNDIFKNWAVANYLNNSSLSGGIYGYQNDFSDPNITNAPGNIQVGTTVSTYPASGTGTANQYAADYVKFTSLGGTYDTFVLIVYNLDQSGTSSYTYTGRLGSLILNLTGMSSTQGMEGVRQGSSNPTPGVVTSLSASNTISTSSGPSSGGGGSSSSSGGGGGGGCFIATSAYGSSLGKEVSILREFRDRFLMANPPGRFFVSAYYAISPPIAHLIDNHESLKAFTRTILCPAVGLSYWFLKDPTGAGLLSVGTFLLIGLVLIKRRKTGTME